MAHGLITINILRDEWKAALKGQPLVRADFAFNNEQEAKEFSQIYLVEQKMIQFALKLKAAIKSRDIPQNMARCARYVSVGFSALSRKLPELEEQFATFADSIARFS